jgi:hypothetical protein
VFMRALTRLAIDCGLRSWASSCGEYFYAFFINFGADVREITLDDEDFRVKIQGRTL